MPQIINIFSSKWIPHTISTNLLFCLCNALTSGCPQDAVEKPDQDVMKNVENSLLHSPSHSVAASEDWRKTRAACGNLDPSPKSGSAATRAARSLNSTTK